MSVILQMFFFSPNIHSPSMCLGCWCMILFGPSSGITWYLISETPGPQKPGFHCSLCNISGNWKWTLDHRSTPSHRDTWPVWWSNPQSFLLFNNHRDPIGAFTSRSHKISRLEVCQPLKKLCPSSSSSWDQSPEVQRGAQGCSTHHQTAMERTWISVLRRSWSHGKQLFPKCKMGVVESHRIRVILSTMNTHDPTLALILCVSERKRKRLWRFVCCVQSDSSQLFVSWTLQLWVVT